MQGVLVTTFQSSTNEGEQEQVNGTYVYRHKHNYIPCSTFTIAKVQLHVSAINVSHLQDVHEEFINKLYQRVWGAYRLWDGVGARDLVCVGAGGVHWSCLGIMLK